MGASLLLAAVLVVGASGCGDEGAEAGATVSVYVSAPLGGAEAATGRRLCAEAREEAERRGNRAGDLKLRIVCLDAAGSGGHWTLARVGANTRRATEDSTTVAYVGEPDPKARRQSRPIVAAAGIAAVGGAGGREAISEVLAAIREDDGGDPRDAVFDALG